MPNDPKPKSRVAEVISSIRGNRAENVKAKAEKIKAKADLVDARAEGKVKKIQARAEAKKVNRDYPLSTTPEPRPINPPVSDYSRSEKRNEKETKVLINPIKGNVSFLTTGKK
jgi:hypothetical protein